jgi:two-component system, OmpR family, phosphate regulon response regulator PhoB
MPVSQLDPNRIGNAPPTARQRPGPTPPDSLAVSDGSDRPLVLIAERDQQVRTLQRFFLERAGFAVEFAEDGASAFGRAHTAPPSVVVTEILLPKLDGLTLCRRLRDDPLTRGIPVVVFSVLAAAARAGEAGAHAFLRKPLIESVFLAAVQDAIAAQPPHSMEQQWASR